MKLISLIYITILLTIYSNIFIFTSEIFFIFFFLIFNFLFLFQFLIELYILILLFIKVYFIYML